MFRILNSPNYERQIPGQLSQTIRNDSAAPKALRQNKPLARGNSYSDCLVPIPKRYGCSNQSPPWNDDISLSLPGGLAYWLANHAHLPRSEVHQ